MEKKEFQVAYEQLNDIEKMIVIFLGLGYQEVRQTHLNQQLNAVNLRTEKGTQFNSGNLKTYLQKLVKKGWVEIVAGQYYQLPLQYQLLATLEAIRHKDFKAIRKAFIPKPIDISWHGFWYNGSRLDLVREMRLAYFIGEENYFQHCLRLAQFRFEIEWDQGYFFTPLTGPLDAEWLLKLSILQQIRHLEWLMDELYDRPMATNELLHFLTRHEKLSKAEGEDLRSILFRLLLFRGEVAAVEALIEAESQLWRRWSYEVCLLVLKGEDVKAIDLFDKTLKTFRQQNKGHKHARLFDLSGVCYVVALLRQAGPDYINLINKYTNDPFSFEEYTNFILAVKSALAIQQNDQVHARKYLEEFRRSEKSLFNWIVYGWMAFWLDHTLSKAELKELTAITTSALEHHLYWFALELSTILSLLHPVDEERQQWHLQSQKIQADSNFQPMIYALPKKTAWERALEVISQLGTSKKNTKQQAQKRLVWLLDLKNQLITPKEQQINKNGQWSAGRNVALKRLKAGQVDGLQQQDQAVISLIREENVYHGWQYHREMVIPFHSAVQALIAHPHLYFMESPGVGLELVSRNLQLLVEEKEDGFLLSFNFTPDEQALIITQETPTRFAVIEVSDIQRQIQVQLGEGLKIPARARKQLEQAVQHISRAIPVSSSLEGHVVDIPLETASTDLVVHLLPMGDGFKIEFFVRPFHPEPPYLKPGGGQDRIISEIRGDKRMAQRRLDRELNNAQLVINLCPALQRLPGSNYEWVIDQPEDCLQVLLELQPLRDSGQIIMEHPKGEPIRLAGSVDFQNLLLQVKKERDWFDVDGSLQINGVEVLHFRELLEKAQDADNYFIQLSDGQYLALTDRFRRKLRELNAVLNRSGKHLQLHPLAGDLLDEMSDLLGEFEEDVAWQETRQRLSNAKKIRPVVPSTFQASLRPYQLDGYNWLMQMANWGVGACLADDMGLGKTIQALAVLVARAEKGPAMVAAPASVTRNWLREAQKFAPTLRPHLLGPGDRTEMIEALGPYDLLLVSYGLLPYEVDKLSAKPFATIILDEAQAIKNRSTKRSKAAKLLQADFRLITTGTPIENHLGELWNLFHFLNPGLLGSLDHFNERFAIPIERHSDHERRMQLRRLLQPFILRRRKNDVLQELPAKTEINLTVELSLEEMAFYEALRQRALEEIEKTDGPSKRFQILAQLTRLRQAACHPQLVDENLQLGSSKLELVTETILELLDNGHKALVFSQFIKHLKLVEDWVKSKEIAYQYLDGQTPGKKRDEAVQAFQRGEGELFLISLKAGGTGLNLTAADFVLHLDPWWNPAVEDQASDRAHRIGQQRPVTVYRFISEYTIEEKIVQLHQDKRDLADNLLTGTDSSAMLSTDELIALIKGN